MMTGYKQDAGGPARRPFFSKLLYAAAPALLHMVIMNAAHTILSVCGVSDSGILLQALSVSASLLFFIWYAVRNHLPIGSRKKGIYRYPASFCYVIAVVMCGVANNYLFSIILSLTGQFSSNYWNVVKVFYKQDLLLEILALCVIGPLAEELVYRGFVYRRLRENSSETKAALWSALLFGLLHFNFVQCVYAFVLGILLAHIVYKTGSLFTAAVAHMAANLVSVLWQETNWLDFLNQTGTRQHAAAVVCLVLMAIFLSYGNQMSRRIKREET